MSIFQFFKSFSVSWGLRAYISHIVPRYSLFSGIQILFHKKPVYKKPVCKKPVCKKPVYKKPVYKKPVYKKPVYKKPVYKKPVYKKPGYKKSNVHYNQGQNIWDFREILAQTFLRHFFDSPPLESRLRKQKRPGAEGGLFIS